MIIFTDLDGTLLDHQTYRFDAAQPALDALKARHIPLILASSKTAAEIAPLQQQLGIDAPAIVENGAGIFWPDMAADHHEQYQKIQQALAAIPSNLRACFKGFADMGVNGIMAATGLSEHAAKLAGDRAYSEPGLFSGTKEQREAFLQELAPFGIQATQGGRFFTLSFGATKADQMQKIIAHFQAQDHRAAPSLALGDAPNDLSMLEAADYGVIVLNKAHDTLPTLKGEHDGTISRTDKEGPEGWNAAILSFLAIQAQDHLNKTDS